MTNQLCWISAGISLLLLQWMVTPVDHGEPRTFSTFSCSGANWITNQPPAMVMLPDGQKLLFNGEVMGNSL